MSQSTISLTLPALLAAATLPIDTFSDELENELKSMGFAIVTSPAWSYALIIGPRKIIAQWAAERPDLVLP